jgi:hypothetical protein
MSWNKDRLAYTPLGPYVAKRYEEGSSYGEIAQEVGIYKGCVQRLCRVIGISPRKNHTTNIADVWEQRLTDYVKRSGVLVVDRPSRLTKSSRVTTRCKHGISERPCSILASLQHCCRTGSKLGENNGVYGTPSWNAGTVGISTGHGFGGKPSEEERKAPGTLYLVRYLDDSGTHFKLGITRRTLKERLGDKLIAIIHLHTASLGECFDLEQDCLRYCKQQGWRYSSPTTTELIHPSGLPYLLDRLTALYSAGKAGYNKLS